MKTDIWIPSKLSDLIDVDPALDLTHDLYGLVVDLGNSRVKAAAIANSVFGRIGAVVAAANDYSFAQLSGYPALTASEAQLGADVTMTLADTAYDAVSLSLAAGTWDINGVVTIISTTTTAADNSAKLWDGTTVYATSGCRSVATTGSASGISLTKRLVLGSTTTVKITCYSHTANVAKVSAAVTNNGGGNNATTITAIRVA